MKSTFFSLFLSLFIFSPWKAAMASPESKGLEIAKKTETANNGYKGEESTVEMTLINAHGKMILRKMTSKTKETKKEGDKSIITFLWPADVKGTKMLTWTHKKKDDDQWLFMPAHRKVRRISSRSKTGSFMASEFSYEDLGSQELEKFKHVFVKDDKLEGRNCWVTNRIPKDKKSGYTKQVVWTDKKHFNPLKVEYYDRRGELLKTAKFTGYKKIKKWWRAEQVKMVNHQTRKSSILSWKNRKLGKSFSDRDFHKKNLSR